MKRIDDYPVQELKRIYLILQAQLAEQPELMDSELLQDLQHLLQARAKAAGIDVSLHAQWAAWLDDKTALCGLWALGFGKAAA